MCNKAIVKAVIGIFIYINTLTAFAVERSFSIEENLYLDTLFKTASNEILLADEIEKLNITSFVKQGEDPLSLNIYASNIVSWQDIRQINNIPERLNFFSKAYLTTHRATLLKMMAINDVIAGKLELARQRFENALFLYQLIRNGKQVAIVAQNLSYINYILGNNTYSLENNKLAVIGFRHLEDTKNLMKSLLWQNDLLILDRNFRQAEEQLLRQILLLSYRMKSKKNEWASYYQLGKLYLQEKKYTESKWFFVQALTLSEKALSAKEQIRTLLMLAKVKTRVNDYQLALGDLKRAENLARENYFVFRVDISRDMASLYGKLGDKEKSDNYTEDFEEEKKLYLGNPI